MNSKIIYISHSNAKPQEGGMARNFAFHKEMEKRGAVMYNYVTLNLIKRLFIMLRNAFLLYSLRNKNILILQNALLLYVFSLNFMKFKTYRKLVQIFLNKITKHNKLFIEVNDLIYEQSIDLNLKVAQNALSYENLIFSQKNVNFIFASFSMATYIMEKYNLSKDNVQVILNGAPTLSSSNIESTVIDSFGDEKIKCIYAGTLDKGRQIEELLDAFKNNKTCILILLGVNGDWINDLKIQNVYYLGRYEESEALKIASKCDLGLIPYDDTKFYYNLCYPTKVSFYISAGIPILSTPLKETMQVLADYKYAAFFLKTDQWNFFLNTITIENINENKLLVNNIRENFSWNFLLRKLYLN